MGHFDSLKGRLRAYAEKTRSSQVFGPTHPAVRAAKRYCERTHAKWEIGIGGRCELGKRAIKQWSYEAWQHVWARWVLIVSILIGLVTLGFVMAPKETMTVLVSVAVAVYAAVGIVSAMAASNDHAKCRKISHALKVCFLVTLPVSGLLYGFLRLINTRFANQYAEKIFVVGLLIGLGSLFCTMIVLTVIKYGFLSCLIGVGIFIGLVLVVLGMFFVSEQLSRAFSRAKRRRTQAYRENRDRVRTKKHRLRDIAGFLAATLFLMKSKVCPSVDLPKWDEVKAHKA